MSEKINSTNYDPTERRQAQADKQRVEAWEGEDPSSETFDDLESYFASRPENNEENVKYKDSLDKTLSQAEQGEYKDRFDQIVQDSRELRFAAMQARNVAKLRNSKLEDLTQGKTLDQAMESLKTAEDMIQERLEKWEKGSELSKEDKDEVINRIFELTVNEAPVKDKEAKSSDENRTVITSDPIEGATSESSEANADGQLSVEHDLEGEDAENVNGEIISDEEAGTELIPFEGELSEDAQPGTDLIETEEVDGEIVESNKDLAGKIKDRVYGSFGRLHARFMEFQKGKKGALVVGLVLGAGAMYLMKNGDGDTANAILDASDIDIGAGDVGADNTPDSPSVSHGGYESTVHSSFSDAARNINPGEGFYQTFQEMNIPESEWSNLLDKAGPRLQEQGLAYPMDGGSWGINMTPSGKMPDSALRIIENARVSR